MPILTLDKATAAYGHLPLFENASLQIEPKERVCLIGRNGTGKSTLLRILSGELQPDTGSVWRQPGLRVGRLTQDVTLDDPRTWTRPWTFASTLTRMDESQRIFEYACHEGNYSLRNMLSGARRGEQTREGK